MLATSPVAPTRSAGTHAGEIAPQVWTYERTFFPRLGGQPTFRVVRLDAGPQLREPAGSARAADAAPRHRLGGQGAGRCAADGASDASARRAALVGAQRGHGVASISFSCPRLSEPRDSLGADHEVHRPVAWIDSPGGDDGSRRLARRTDGGPWLAVGWQKGLPCGGILTARRRHAYIVLVLSAARWLKAAPVEPDEIAATLRPIVQQAMKQSEGPGLAIAVLRDGGRSSGRRSGVLDLALREPVTADTRFHLASVTKTFVATAVLQLAEQGRVDLDAHPRRYLPYFQPAGARAEKLTIRQVLAHVSGLQKDDDTRFDNPDFDDGALERLVRESVSRPLDFAPGEKFGYNNLGYCVLGDIVAKVSGETFEPGLVPVEAWGGARGGPQRLRHGTRGGHGAAAGAWDRDDRPLQSGPRAIPPLMLAALDAALGRTPEVVFKPSLARDLYRVMAAQGAESAVARYREIKREQPGPYDLSEWVLNDLGYELAARGKLQEAVRMLRLNVEEYPASANVYDSLADVCCDSGDKACALENYRKALEKNARNKKAAEMLEKLDSPGNPTP